MKVKKETSSTVSFEEISKNTNLEIKLKGKNSFFLVSIVVPCLNEEEKISKVLELNQS